MPFNTKKNLSHLGIYPLFSHLCVTVLQRVDNYRVHFEDGTMLRYVLAHAAMDQMPWGNQNTRRVFVFDVPCFDKVNQRTQAFRRQQQQSVPLLLSQPQNRNSFFVCLTLNNVLLSAVSPLFSNYKCENCCRWQRTV